MQYQLTVILSEEHCIPRDLATLITQTYLRNFRLCPDNPEMSLDKWRCLLWANALGDQYASIASEVYVQWLQLRYQCLALSADVTSLLTKLRQHYLLGLITNGPSNAQWEKIKRLDIERHFDCVLVSGDLPWEKPQEEIFLKACTYLSVGPESCLMVGDKLGTDIQGGKEAALGATVWIPLAGDHAGDNDPRPDFILDSVMELPCLLPVNPPHLPRQHVITTVYMEDGDSNASDGS